MPEQTASPFAPKSVAEVNEMVTAAQRGGCDEHLLAELHERALIEDQARAETPDGDEWMRGYLIAQMEWARPWPTDPR